MTKITENQQILVALGTQMTVLTDFEQIFEFLQKPTEISVDLDSAMTKSTEIGIFWNLFGIF